MKTKLVLLAGVALLCCLCAPVFSQAPPDAGEAERDVEITAILKTPLLAYVVLSNESVLTLTPDEADRLAAQYGNPTAVVHVAWESDGVTVTLEVRQQAGESDVKFAKRAAQTVAQMKQSFPPDPKSTWLAMTSGCGAVSSIE